MKESGHIKVMDGDMKAVTAGDWTNISGENSAFTVREREKAKERMTHRDEIKPTFVSGLQSQQMNQV